MIDCDIHPQLGNVDEFLGYVEPAQREWFRLQGPTLGLPGYPWNHPSSFFRQDLEHGEALPPGSTAAEVVRDLLDPYDVDVGVLNGDDAIYLSLVASPYRATEFARAHNEWIRERWLDADPRLRGGIVCAVQDPLAAASEIRRVAQDPRFVHVVLVGGSERPYGEPRYLPIFEAAAECGLPIAIHSGGEGMGLGRAPRRCRDADLLHRVAHPGLRRKHHGAPRVADLPRRLRAASPPSRSCLLEGGLAWLPGILWRLDTNWRALRLDTPWLERKPSEVAREHVKFTTQPLEHTDGHDELLFQMLEAAGAPDNLCFASDYPHWDGDDPAYMLKRLPETWRERVMSGSAAELYGERLGLVAA